jgi:hypothetical protein
MESVVSTMGSHPDALIFAPLTEGGSTLSMETANELSCSGSGSNSGSGSSSMGSGSTIGECGGSGAGAAGAIGFFSAWIKCAPPFVPQTLPFVLAGGENGAGVSNPEGIGSAGEVMFAAKPPRSTGTSSSGSMM